MMYNETELYCVPSTLHGKRISVYQLATWKNGLPFRKIDFSDKGKPIIKIAELNGGITASTSYTEHEYSRDVFLTKGDLVFSWSGNPDTSIDVYRYSLPDGWLNQHIFKVTANRNFVSADYLYYILKFLKPNFSMIAKNKQTTGLGHVTIADLQRMSVIVPSFECQDKISGILKAIDDKIENNNAINHNLQQQVFALFDHLFPNISDGLCTIGDYITPKRGRNLLSKDAVPGTVPVVAGGLEPSTYHNTANTLAPVLTISASGANAGFVNLWHTPVWSSDSSFIDSSMTEDVYFWFVMLKKRQREIFDAQTGSAQPHIYPQHIAAMTIRSLDKALMSDFASQVTPLFALIGANKDENDRLASVRDALLPKLMSGEIDVSEVEL